MKGWERPFKLLLGRACPFHEYYTLIFCCYPSTNHVRWFSPRDGVLSVDLCHCVEHIKHLKNDLLQSKSQQFDFNNLFSLWISNMSPPQFSPSDCAQTPGRPLACPERKIFPQNLTRQGATAMQNLIQKKFLHEGEVFIRQKQHKDWVSG